MKNRPYLLTIAGFDPSSGAGLTSDVKTFEALKCYGLSVCTANTIQNDIEFTACHWTAIDVMLNQINLLFNRFEIDYVKIGIVKNWETLSVLIDRLIALNPEIKIVLDPILKSSSEFCFHSNNSEKLDVLLSKIYLLTPNYNEIQSLYPEKNVSDTIDHMASKTNVFLKGGHRADHVGQDVLYSSNKKQVVLNPRSSKCSEKHGSGCVLSSAITSYLTLGFSLEKACKKAKRYTENFLSSNESLLGFH